MGGHLTERQALLGSALARPLIHEILRMRAGLTANGAVSRNLQEAELPARAGMLAGGGRKGS